MRKKYDWNALKTEFVTGDISAAALAKKHGVSPQTLYRHYQIERWSELRREYLENVVEKCADKAAYIAAIKLSKELDIANKLGTILDTAATDEKQFKRYIVKEKAEDGSVSAREQIFEKVDMKALGEAIKALGTLEQIKRVMYGIATPEQERRLRIEEARLGGAAEQNTGGVVILPQTEEDEDDG